MRWLERLSLVLLALSSAVGCQAILYPLARAFGGPKESDLKVCRQAFTEMKAEIRDGSMVVFAPLVITPDTEPVRNPEATAGEVTFLRERLGASVGPASESPDVPYEPMGRNQLRYSVKRARLYAEWVSAHRPEGDRFLFTEVLRSGTEGNVVAGHIYIIDAQGRVAYGRLFNSHRFDPSRMTSVGAFVEWMLSEFLSDLEEDPLKIFPRYGVG